MIDMKSESSWNAVLERFREALRNDPARTRMTGLGEFGLITLTRKASRASLGDQVTSSCPECGGSGRVEMRAGRNRD